MKPPTNRPLLIRPVVDTDFEQWLPLWTGYNTFYERTLPEEITRRTWARFLDPGEPLHALVAEQNGALLGLVHYLFHRATATVEDACYLADLFTSRQARGKGVGRLLIEAVYEAGRAAGCSRVYWQTHETNAVAQVLYNEVADRSGFIVYRKQL
ncbi:MAG: GNAT family N-acetyltransferase [Proteobacteria bacterium]|nr:GNAT family N-acetyltransferase [Pseudomonadota bacterium]